MTATAITPVNTAASSDVATASRRSVGRRMWAVGAIAGLVSSLVVIAIVAIAEAAGVPMEVAESSAKTPEHIPLIGYATVVLGSTVVGLLIATALARWTKRPRTTFVVAALALTAFSFAFPATTTATTATKVVLELTHLIPAVVVIPAIAFHLASRRVRGATG